MREKHALATWNLGNHCSVRRQKKTNRCRDGRSQDLPEACWLQATSPANKR